MYHSIAELLKEAAGSSLHEAVLADEVARQDCTVDDVYATLEARYAVMLSAAQGALVSPPDGAFSFIRGQSSTQMQHGGKLCGPFLNRVMARALSCSEVNACMGLICAAPTAGACGILPAVLIETSELLGASRRETLEALAVAGGFGAVVTRNATVSGAEGGCQAECGVAAAMAAAAATHLAKGTPEQCADAFSLALINCMGLICDPVAGLVQLPCSYRNASQSVNALLSADMALAGQHCLIPPDEVIDAMYRVGRQLPSELRETAEGGIAASPTARQMQKDLRAQRIPASDSNT